MDKKILTLLGFASKSRKLSYGAAASADSVNAGKSKLIIISGDISEKSKKEMIFVSEKNNVPVIVLGNVTSNVISNAVGRNCGILSVNDKSFASGIAEEYGRKC